MKRTLCSTSLYSDEAGKGNVEDADISPDTLAGVTVKRFPLVVAAGGATEAAAVVAPLLGAAGEFEPAGVLLTGSSA